MADFNPTIDVDIDEDTPTTNHDGTSENAGAGSTGKNTTTDRRVLMKFDLTSLGSPFTVGVVTLDYYLTSSAGAGSTPLHALHRVTQTAWTEAGATWNKYDGVTNWATAGGDYDTGTKHTWTPSGTSGAYRTIPDGTNFRALVQDAIDNRSGILWLLWKEDDESDTTNQLNLTFHSRTGANPPILHVAAATTSSFDLPPAALVGLGVGIV